MKKLGDLTAITDKTSRALTKAISHTPDFNRNRDTTKSGLKGW